MLRWESQRAAAPDAASWVASACLSEPQADIPLPPDTPSESTSPGARLGDRGPHAGPSALSGLGRYPGADVHGGERTRATGAGRAALAPGRERPAAAGRPGAGSRGVAAGG